MTRSKKESGIEISAIPGAVVLFQNNSIRIAGRFAEAATFLNAILFLMKLPILGVYLR
ncbi:MAG: hypothetical protein J7K90_10655 [Desulfuromusa sp.]|nr:hypothetical protein [Desulfuromusa sp.]